MTLIAYYPLNGRTGPYTKDHAGGNDGDTNAGMFFDKTDDGVEIPTPNPVDETSFTFSFWTKPNMGTAENRYAYDMRGEFESIIGVDSGTDSFAYWNGSWTNIPSIENNDNVWHHVAVRSDGSSTQIYVDGELDVDIASGSASNSNGTPHIGCKSGTNNFYGGYIAEFRAYDSVLSEAEIQTLSRGEQSQTTPTYYYRLDTVNSGTVTDEVNSYDGTAVGSPKVHQPDFTAVGILGKTAASFDGSNDYVDIGGLGIWNTQPWTITAWVKTSVSANMRILSDYDGASGSGPEFHSLQVDNLDVANVSLRDANDTLTSLNGNKVITDGEWHQVCTVVRPSEIEIYVDGLLDASQSHSLGSDMNSDGNDYIGSHPYDSNSVFNGEIAEVRVYDHALTPSEVQYLYEVSQVGSYASRGREL